jgi:predicted nucleic acid-binding protein
MMFVLDTNVVSELRKVRHGKTGLAIFFINWEMICLGLLSGS